MASKCFMTKVLLISIVLKVTYTELTEADHSVSGRIKPVQKRFHLKVVKPFLFIRGLSCLSSVEKSSIQNCLKLTTVNLDFLPASFLYLVVT
jgi:hypothetical protein